MVEQMGFAVAGYNITRRKQARAISSQNPAAVDHQATGCAGA
jgi:hypothetical protein